MQVAGRSRGTAPLDPFHQPAQISKRTVCGAAITTQTQAFDDREQRIASALRDLPRGIRVVEPAQRLEGPGAGAGHLGVRGKRRGASDRLLSAPHSGQCPRKQCSERRRQGALSGEFDHARVVAAAVERCRISGSGASPARLRMQRRCQQR